jgi:hypothetical protein
MVARLTTKQFHLSGIGAAYLRFPLDYRQEILRVIKILRNVFARSKAGTPLDASFKELEVGIVGLLMSGGIDLASEKGRSRFLAQLASDAETFCPELYRDLRK